MPRIRRYLKTLYRNEIGSDIEVALAVKQALTETRARFDQELVALDRTIEDLAFRMLQASFRSEVPAVWESDRALVAGWRAKLPALRVWFCAATALITSSAVRS